MNSINHEDFINELKFCIEQDDIVKAKALLQFASDSNADLDLQKLALLELGKSGKNLPVPGCRS